MNLLENKKFIIIVLILNCIVACILVGYLVRAKISEQQTKNQVKKTANQETVSIDESEDDLTSIYMSLLQGSHFDLGDDIHLYFDENGEYSGFFDSNNPDVSGYLYSIAINNETVYLQIFNKDKSKVVQYEVTFDNEDNIVLKHPNMDEPIILSY